MQIVLGPDLQPTLQEEWEFRKFAVHLRGSAAAATQVPDALLAVGVAQGADALWVRPAWLRANSSCAGNGEWQAGFDAMVEAARSHGWVDPVTGNIKAHIERGG